MRVCRWCLCCARKLILPPPSSQKMPTFLLFGAKNADLCRSLNLQLIRFGRGGSPTLGANSEWALRAGHVVVENGPDHPRGSAVPRRSDGRIGRVGHHVGGSFQQRPLRSSGRRANAAGRGRGNGCSNGGSEQKLASAHALSAHLLKYTLLLHSAQSAHPMYQTLHCSAQSLLIML